MTSINPPLLAHTLTVGRGYLSRSGDGVSHGREMVSLTVGRWCLSRSGDGVSPDSHPIPTGFCAWYTPRASPECYATLTGQFRYLFRNCSLLHNQGLHLQYRYRNTYQLLYLQYLILKLLNSILYS